ncbi:MAG: hypothetical protein WCK89_16535 [bacterium]
MSGPVTLYTNGTGGGAWATPATWAGGVVPVIANGQSAAIRAGDTVDVVPAGQVCVSNLGTVTLNSGTVTENGFNAVLAVNAGTVTKNAEGGTIVRNAAAGVVALNDGYVTANYGTVTLNEFRVTSNYGVVYETGVSGTVGANVGTVGISHGTVAMNFGVVTVNVGTVGKNYGSVEHCSGTIAVDYALLAGWRVYDGDCAAATLPPELADAYGSWLTAEARLVRIGVIASGIVADFRDATLADADETGSTNPQSVPASCLRHVAAVLWNSLAGECGMDTAEYRAGWQDAEIYLRRLYQDLKAGGAASGAAGTPAYSAAASRTGGETILYGQGGYVPVGATGTGSGSGGGIINLGL